MWRLLIHVWVGWRRLVKRILPWPWRRLVCCACGWRQPTWHVALALFVVHMSTAVRVSCVYHVFRGSSKCNLRSLKAHRRRRLLGRCQSRTGHSIDMSHMPAQRICSVLETNSSSCGCPGPDEHAGQSSITPQTCTLQSMPASCNSTSKKKPCMPSGAIASRKTSSTMEMALKKMNCSEQVEKRMVCRDPQQMLSCGCTWTSILICTLAARLSTLTSFISSWWPCICKRDWRT